MGVLRARGVAAVARIKRGWAKIAVFALLPTLLLAATAEVVVRIVLTARYGRIDYLIAPFGRGARAQAAYPGGDLRQTVTHYDPCSGRQLTYTLSPDGGRGAHWTPAREPGTRRVLVVGESSTFGVNSPDDATWPAQLEAAYRRAGVPVEVLNGGQGGAGLAALIAKLELWLPRYGPEVVIYYGAHNDANPDTQRMQMLHEGSALRRLARGLYYRSMLYTYLIEKIHLVGQTTPGAAPDREAFRGKLETMFALIRRYKARPVVVLQATQVSVEAEAAAAAGLDAASLAERLTSLAARSAREDRDRIHRLRALKTQVLVEIARETARARDAAVIDPRAALADGAGGFFCDEIHMTDRGNAVLADSVAHELAP